MLFLKLHLGVSVWQLVQFLYFHANLLDRLDLFVLEYFVFDPVLVALIVGAMPRKSVLQNRFSRLRQPLHALLDPGLTLVVVQIRIVYLDYLEASESHTTSCRTLLFLYAFLRGLLLLLIKKFLNLFDFVLDVPAFRLRQ